MRVNSLKLAGYQKRNLETSVTPIVNSRRDKNFDNKSFEEELQKELLRLQKSLLSVRFLNDFILHLKSF